jgi:hypothetical protein
MSNELFIVFFQGSQIQYVRVFSYYYKLELIRLYRLSLLNKQLYPIHVWPELSSYNDFVGNFRV